MTARLAGRRVVVTRAAEQAGPLVELLRAEGAEVVEVPLIRIVEPADGGAALARSLASLERYDWLVVTSPNGARAVREALADRPLGAPQVAAVGPATAAELGRPVELVPERSVAEGLLEVMPSAPPGGRVLLPQADGARAALAEGLRAAGWQVDAVEAYRTVPVDPDPGLLAEAEAADALLLASGSAARAWAAATARTPRHVVTIGPVTSEVARDLGLKVDAEAADHSLAGLIDALTALLGGR